MTVPPPPLGRRRALQILGSLPVLGGAGDAVGNPAAPPDSISMIVAGPDGGELDRWSRLLGPLLGRYLPPGAPLRTMSAGAADGVTGANQFDARTAPDGSTALLVPGAAALAWLAGDPRARFDAGHWLPVMAGISPGIVVRRPGEKLLGKRPRLAVAGPAGPEMTALLALDLLGAEPVAVFGILDRTAARDAFARQDVDLVFVSGRHVPNRLAALAAVGARPVFSLGALESEGRITRDPLFPDVPEMTEIYANRHGLRPEGPLFDAWMATAAAVRLDFGLILPQLTPASLVALWRHAGAQAAVSPDVISAAAAAGVQPLAGSAATASTASILADSNAILELRRWLGARYDWHPG